MKFSIFNKIRLNQTKVINKLVGFNQIYFIIKFQNEVNAQDCGTYKDVPSIDGLPDEEVVAALKPFSSCCKKQSWSCGRKNGWCMQTKYFKKWCDFTYRLCPERTCTCCASKYVQFKKTYFK